MDSGRNNDLAGMFHSFLQQYWSPARMGMQSTDFQSMLGNAKNTLDQVIPGFGASIDQAKSSVGMLDQIFKPKDPGQGELAPIINSAIGGFNF